MITPLLVVLLIASVCFLIETAVTQHDDSLAGAISFLLMLAAASTSLYLLLLRWLEGKL